MTSRDVRYGRRGGRWLTETGRDDVCHTCRHATARHQAHHRTTGDTWPICTRCADQAHRHRTPITTTPLTTSHTETDTA